MERLPLAEPLAEAGEARDAAGEVVARRLRAADRGVRHGTAKPSRPAANAPGAY